MMPHALAANSQGVPFVFAHKQSLMLEFLDRNAKGRMPNGTYVLLGEDPHGTLDATRFGLVHVSDILGVYAP